MKFELYMQLAEHHEMMRSWASDVEWLWRKTRVAGSSHDWFEIIGRLHIVPQPIDDPPPEAGSEEQDEALQEEEFLDNADDGELAADENVRELVGGGGWETDEDYQGGPPSYLGIADTWTTEEHLQKYEPNTEFVALTWESFKVMSLDDPFWNDAAYCGSEAPWALSMDVREGIRACHMVDRAEEELDLITQELGRALTWAVELNSQLSTLANRINNLPPNSEEVVTSTRVGTLDPQTGQVVMKFELYMQLAEHHEMMRSWASDVEWLWRKTRVAGSSHDWFEIIGRLHIVPQPIDDPPPEAGSEEQDEALQEEEFLDNADDGELAADENVRELVGGGGWETDED
ncbi:hypothetical protein PSTG_17980 [Puccinia striiformis f. sp. tritici PST-78]|uniref:Uncharacterized protein n=1 Tax=Puccinia striiformis f. sp. tritici PST-78 TaxID=1165861 RepID=A0A0L0UNF5_9BASI|nr:hypothetical protein PSTG_17980 [Puccinia striiformis f. sp. tritici PST-78]